MHEFRVIFTNQSWVNFKAASYRSESASEYVFLDEDSHEVARVLALNVAAIIMRDVLVQYQAAPVK